jgi:hypothetical protein
MLPGMGVGATEAPLAVWEAANGNVYRVYSSEYDVSYSSLQSYQQTQAVFNGKKYGRIYAAIRGQLWSLSPKEFHDTLSESAEGERARTFVLAAAIEHEQAAARKLARAQALINADRMKTEANSAPGPRKPILDEVKMFVWQRDGGRCVGCSSNADLEYDHIIPHVMGGSDSARNLQLLCGTCNRAKGGNLTA